MMKRKLAVFQDKAAQLSIAGSIAIEQDLTNPEQSRQASARCARYLDELGKMLGVDKHLMDINKALNDIPPLVTR